MPPATTTPSAPTQASALAQYAGAVVVGAAISGLFLLIAWPRATEPRRYRR